ncbi:hypothetical protein KBY58_05890 [Cyanobium sp. HWJ4-Hawea]|uniref:hypothetical protein n=1 Tax=Cyanobium sp. HWJ4-Hawea TaxID=2823713 RepID=UPI0020CBA5E5|nr:hypothetical protein [Cyanobium sp. HWJ4-Hawea]MCP9808958.1 hypothetical protein [Cyanobium sp. HWJ4-Hawea]
MEIKRLNHLDDLAVQRYEEAFYLAFSRAKSNRLIRQLWNWDDVAGRIRTKIPYQDQHIFLLRAPDGNVDTATAINWRMEDYQAAQLGFIPPESIAGHAEILTLFSRKDADLEGLRRFMKLTAEECLALGLRSADATCTNRLLPIYQHLGGEALASRLIDGEQRTLLRFELEPLATLKELT